MISSFLVGALAFVAPARAGVKYPDCVNGPLKSNLVCNTAASPEARASAVVAAMNNNEKFSNLIKSVSIPSKPPLSGY